MSDIGQNSPPGSSPEAVVTKQTYRRKVWEDLEKNNLSTFPLPYGRIPNFKGVEDAASKLLELEEFKKATTVEVNPDKPLEPSRFIALKNKKTLYVPIPRLKEGLLKKLTVDEEDDKIITKTVSRWGIENLGRTISLNDSLKIDLLIVGSVAVSKEGYRIGKGKGYADLEYAILKEIKAIDDNTVIVTTVHDSQVFDELPKDLFQAYDVPVDFILTPTKIIQVENRLPKPKGIFWNLLSKRRVNLIQVLQILKEHHEKEGIDTTLKEVDTDVEQTEPRKFNKFKRFVKRRPRSESKTSGEANNSPENSKNKYTKRRFFNRSRSAKKDSILNGSTTENNENIPPKKTKLPKKGFRRFQFEFSLLVSNIEKNVRVRDLKNALNEHGIKPDDITWRGYKGFCYLHYFKPAIKKNDQEKPLAVDNVIEILQSLKIKSDSTNNLNVKMMEPITKNESNDVKGVTPEAFLLTKNV